MSNIYDHIANVSIDVQGVVENKSDLEKILIIGALPKVAPTNAPAQVGYYTSLKAVTDAGWVAESETASALDPVGVAAKIAFSQNPKPEEIYIAPIQVTGSGNEATAEYPSDTAARAVAVSNDWYVCCPVGLAKADLALLAAYIDTQDKLMVYNEEAFFAAGTGNTDEAMITAKTARVFGVFCKTVSNEPVSSIPAENHYGMNVAFTIAWLAHKTGSETAAYKTLIGVTPASLTQAEIDSLEDHCINYVSKVGSRTVTMLGKALGGEWLDVLRFRDWLKTAIQVAIAEVFISMPKVPFTDGGITLIHNALESVLKEGVESGGIAPTSYDANGNEVASYSISVPRATDISAATMATRKLSGITWSAITSSAIHLVRLNGTLTYAY